jgi:hypothetical protein
LHIRIELCDYNFERDSESKKEEIAASSFEGFSNDLAAKLVDALQTDPDLESAKRDQVVSLSQSFTLERIQVQL